MEVKMKKIVVVVALSLVAVSAYAMKPCEELKTEIEAKLNAKGVKNYSLEIVSKDDVKTQKVVGSCEGGTKKITYLKNAASPADSKPEK
jgi:hypothetical protein